MTERRASKPRGTPNFSAEPLKRLDKKIGSPTRKPLKRVLTRTVPSWPPPSSFTSNKEMTTMTNALEIHIEELRAELRNADPAERAQIAAELEQAQSELAAANAEQEDAEPPH